MRQAVRVLVVWSALGLCLATVQAEPTGTAFAYQGQLKLAGRPVDATCVFEFSLHDASVAGAQIGPTLRFDGVGTNPPAVSVVDGLFQAGLNFGADVFDGDARWLQTAVCCSPADCTDPLNIAALNPRQELTPTPYALHTRGIASNESGYIGIGTNSPQFPLEVQTSSADTAVFVSTSAGANAAAGSTGGPAEDGTRPTALDGESASMGGVGLSGDALATTGDGRGVLGRSSADAGIGVLGRAFHPTGSTIGVSGEADSPEGIGVVGTANVGVEGRANADEGTGVRGVAELLTGRTVGVEGTSDSSDGVGVFGFASATSGIAAGVQGESDSPEGTGVVGTGPRKGVIGEATDPEPVASIGVIGRSVSRFGTGVRGEANATETPGFGVGVVGITQGDGRGVLGFHGPLPGFGAGVEGCSSSPDGFGVLGNHNATSGEGAGVSGSSFSPDGFGVIGEHEMDSGEGGGILGATHSPDGFAGKFVAPAGNQGALTVANEGGDARVQVSTRAVDSGRIATFGPNNNENVKIGSLSTNANHGFIDIRDAAGVEKVKAYVDDSESGVIQTQSPNGSRNVLISSLINNPFIGFIGVSNFSGADRVKISADGVGVVKTLGFNGSENVVIGASGAIGNERNQGSIEVINENDETLVGMTIQNDEGHIQVSDAVGNPKLTMKSLNSVGSILTQGPNGLANVFISNTNSNLNLGSIWVGDTNGQPRALMSVDEQGMGVIAADVKNFRVANPDQPGTDIWYASVEGPEAAAYIRGTATLVDGHAVVTLPDHFRAVSVEAGMTVQLTPLSADSLGLAVVRKSLDGIIVRELHRGRGHYAFDYLVTAVRKGHDDYRVIRPSNETEFGTAMSATRPSNSGDRSQTVGTNTAADVRKGGVR